MHRLVSNFASKARIARKCTTQIGSRLCSTRSYSATDIRSGVDDTGQVSMRTKGCNVSIEQSDEGNIITITQSWREPKVKKDDATVAKTNDIKEKVENIGSSFFKPVAKATNNVAPDGTTYAALLARAILTEGCKLVESERRSEYCKLVESGRWSEYCTMLPLRRGIKLAVATVLKNLKSRARMISTFEEIAQVGTTAANGDREIGELIAKAIESVGKDGAITVQARNILFSELEVVEGMKIDRGYRSPLFITNKRNQTCELENPLILIHEKQITSPQYHHMSTILELAIQKLEHPFTHSHEKNIVANFEYMSKVLDLALKEKRSLLIIAEDLDSFSVAGLIWKTPRAEDVSRLGLSWNTPQAEMKLCALKAPGFGEARRAYMQDLATLTGAQVISEERGMSLEKVDLSMLGSCKKVIVSKDNTIFIGGAGDKKYIRERCEELRSMVEATQSDYDKERLQDRLAKLSGRVAVIKVGRTSEREVVNNALNATKAALEEGIVPGGGVALLHASKELEKLSTGYFVKTGVQIIQNALEIPVYTIASNAGVDGDVIVDKLLESDNPDIGYDAVKGEYVDMVKSGIIDPVKVIRAALLDATKDSNVSRIRD